MVEHSNQAVIDVVRERECGGTGRGPVGAGAYATAVANYNEACATEAMRAARAIATGTRETLDRQVAGLTRALDALTHVDGVKHVVLVSAGFATIRAAATLHTVGRAAARAGARLAVVTEDLDAVDVAESGHTLNDLGAVTYATGVLGRRGDDRAMRRSSLQALAEMAGGTHDVAAGTGDAAFARALRAAAAVYRLTIDRPDDVPKSGAMDLVVSTPRAGVVVHANRLAVIDTGAQAPPEDGRDLPVRLAVVRRAASGLAGVELGVGLAGRAPSNGPPRVTLGLIDARGVLRQGTRSVVPDDGGVFSLTVPMAVEPGLYGVRVSVTDAQGRAGRVDSTLEARLRPVSGVLASDVLTWWTDASGRAQLFALDEVPDGVANVSAAIELQTPDGRPPRAAWRSRCRWRMPPQVVAYSAPTPWRT